MSRDAIDLVSVIMLTYIILNSRSLNLFFKYTTFTTFYFCMITILRQQLYNFETLFYILKINIVSQAVYIHNRLVELISKKGFNTDSSLIYKFYIELSEGDHQTL